MAEPIFVITLSDVFGLIMLVAILICAVSYWAWSEGKKILKRRKERGNG